MGNGIQRHVLVVDDNVTNLKFAEHALKPEYRVTSLISGEQALKFLTKNKPDLILLDIKMPGMDGFETIKQIKSNPGTKDIPVIFLTAISESDSEVNGLMLGAADFISKPFVPDVMLRRVELQIELKNYRDNLEHLVKDQTQMVERLQDVIVSSITGLVEFRDKITGGHAKRSAEYLGLFIEKIKEKPEYAGVFNDEYVTNILRAAPLHDVGKIGINDNVLMKTGFLDDSEFEYMKQHTILGGMAFEKALEELPDNEFLKVAKDMALCHHERWNGTGYPHGLKGEDIPFSARLMAIADVYDALTTKRSYKEPSSHEDAMKIMCELRGVNFEPKLIDYLVEFNQDFKKQNDRYKASNTD